MHTLLPDVNLLPPLPGSGIPSQPFRWGRKMLIFFPFQWISTASLLFWQSVGVSKISRSGFKEYQQRVLGIPAKCLGSSSNVIRSSSYNMLSEFPQRVPMEINFRGCSQRVFGRWSWRASRIPEMKLREDLQGELHRIWNLKTVFQEVIMGAGFREY